MKTEKTPTYYNTMYQKNKEYRKPPEESIYFPLWEMIRNNIEPGEKIIELGCGPGQLAKLLHTHGHNYRLGIDFSMRAIQMATEINPGLNFTCENVFLFLEIAPPFDTVIITEVLEHVTYDTDLISKIPKGKKVILSVPNFDDPAHLRHFKNPQQVTDRYGKYFKMPYIETHTRGKQQWFLLTAIKK